VLIREIQASAKRMGFQVSNTVLYNNSNGVVEINNKDFSKYQARVGGYQTNLKAHISNMKTFLNSQCRFESALLNFNAYGFLREFNSKLLEKRLLGVPLHPRIPFGFLE
jgi:hypothetical protein